MLHTDLLPNNQGIYAPLSQTMTDSDEEIEIHNAKNHHLQQQKRPLPPNNLALKLQHNRNIIPSASGAAAAATATAGGGAQLNQSNHHKFQLDTSTTSTSSNYTTNMHNTFRSVMLSDLGSTHGSGAELTNFNSEYDMNGDSVAILGGSGGGGTEESKRTPMSPMRRCCFIGSLLLCVVAVVSFVWIVPCGNPDGSGSCPAVVDRIKTHNWFNNYTKIELKGGINVVTGVRSWENNLIFLYRGNSKVFPDHHQPTNHKPNGIISLIGSSGVVAWFYEMVDEPVAIDCTLFDVDNNGRPDCLVIDEYGEVGAINPVSGQWYWHYKERSAFKVDAYDFPLILPDLDEDGVLDILIISSLSLEKRTKTFVQQQQQPGTPIAAQLEVRNVLRILSGRSGSPIGEGVRIHECTQLTKLQLEHAATVSYTCIRNKTEVQRSKTLSELYRLVTNKSIVGQLLPASKISQRRHFGQRKDIDSQRNTYSLSGRELVVENRGKCPQDCNVTLVLTEVRNGKPFVLRNFTNSGMYGMVPAQWHFKNSESKMSGFVMKFWKWQVDKNNVAANKQSSQQQYSNNIQKNYTNSTMKHMNNIKDGNNILAKSSTTTTTINGNKTQQKKQQQHQQQQQRIKRSFEHEFPAANEEFDKFDHLISKREAYGLHAPAAANQTNKTKPGPGQTLLVQNYKMQMITETVILVLFMGADTRIENTSQSNIIQFCRNNHSEVVCQPDLNNQENSMLIADLDQDGSQELVSYMSTFVRSYDEPENWKLVTYVRLLRLQSELLNLYDDETRN